MARIPDYDVAGTTVARAQTPRFVDRSAQIEGETQQQLVSTIGGIADRITEHDDKLSYAAARGAILKADVEARDTLRNDPNPDTYETRYRESLRKARDAAAKSIRGRQSRELFQADVDADIERGALQVKGIARERITDQARATLQSTLETGLQSALDSADEGSAVASIQNTNTAITAAYEAGHIDAVVAEKLRSGFRQDYAQGRVALSPLDKRIELLSNPKGTVAEVIPAERRAALLDRAREEKRVLEAREQALADRREARAERAVFQLEQQIASGVPVTAELNKRWADAVKGTSFAVEFEQVQRSERQVQDMLRKPIGEQLTYVQEREAKLRSEGGSQRDIANFARLKRAVQENVQTIQSDPLLFLSQRTGEEFAPLDFNALASGDPEQGALLDDRVTALRAARDRVGAAVPVKPFLPQEAEELAAALQQGSAKQQAELLSTLHENFRDQEAFTGAMQQIAPDAPVKALAGIIASKDAQVVTERGFFGGVKAAQSAKSVARTLLEGEAILNPSGSDKKQDGAPKVGLYLPDTAALQEEFTSEVGDAFRGREPAAQLAFQAVKAYYVGKASQTGRIAASKDDVDQKLVRESVASVLGSVVDYNGAGKVITPWGMSVDEFEDRAGSAFRIQASRQGIPTEVIDDLENDITLQNLGSNRYGVANGNAPVLDSLGNPVIIEVDDFSSRKPLK